MAYCEVATIFSTLQVRKTSQRSSTTCQHSMSNGVTFGLAELQACEMGHLHWASWVFEERMCGVQTPDHTLAKLTQELPGEPLPIAALVFSPSTSGSICSIWSVFGVCFLSLLAIV